MEQILFPWYVLEFQWRVPNISVARFFQHYQFPRALEWKQRQKDGFRIVDEIEWAKVPLTQVKYA